MSSSGRKFTGETLVVAFFGFLTVVGCVCAASVLALSSPGTGETFYELAPFFLGLALASVGGAVMVGLRRRFNVAGPILLVAMVVWFMGATIFAFGLLATLLYDEPAKFLPNLGFAVGMCLGPGALLALIAMFLYAFEARRGMKKERARGETAVSHPSNEADWLQSLKADEKARFDSDQ
ncbi:MAG: hypothetical protein KBE23_09860 [Chloroflexi bacterium]|nr:hypothetical protein [Chloroflexota bacterium]MBP7043038.1 hypothetical protein [Chloroflexota bacterium]